jgi:hypothetical protein
MVMSPIIVVGSLSDSRLKGSESDSPVLSMSTSLSIFREDREE